MLDFKTLYLVAAVVTLSGAGAVLLTWYHHRDAPALRAWAAALLVGNLGAVIVRVAGPFSSIQSTLVSNLLIIAGFALIWANQYLANRDRLGVSRQVGFTVAVCAAYAVLFAVIFSAGAGQGMRSTSVLFSLFLAVLSLATAWEFRRGMARDGLRSRIVVVWAFVAMSLARLARATAVSLEATNVIDGKLSLTVTGYALYATVILVLAITYGLIQMANEAAARRDERLFAGG